MIEIDRLRAIYGRDDPRLVERFDAALQILVDSELVRALGPADDTAHRYVCIEHLAAPVTLDGGAPPSELARRWADSIARSLHATTTTETGTVGTGVVVYRREADALIDMIRRTAVVDVGRVWAWHRIGLLAPWRSAPTTDDVVRALQRAPEHIPTVIGAVADEAGTLLPPAAWVVIARSVESVLPPMPTAAVPPGPARPASTDADIHEPSAQARALIAPMPWRTVGPADRRRLARLVVCCITPHDVTRRDRVDQIARWGLHATTLRPSTTRDDEVPTGRDHETDRSDADHVATDWDEPAIDLVSPTAHPDSHAADETGGADPTIETSAEGPAPVATRFGGVLFLVHILRDLGAAPSHRPPSDEASLVAVPAAVTWPMRLVIARVVHDLTGVALDDPAVMAMSGITVDDLAEIDDTASPADATTADYIAELTAAGARELHERLERAGFDTEADALEAIWQRDAALSVEPGWISAEFGLDQVDVTVRTAGLDVDPGFVWWLGAVMEFRYV